MSTTKTLRLDALVPYWRNPRRISDEAVDSVMDSIKEFGYQRAIAVDSDNVIVLGHTRYAALRRMGYTSADVTVLDDLTPTQIKQLRVIDNRTSELGTWDYEQLVTEMGDLDETLMTRFFPEVASQVYDAIIEKTDDIEVDPSKWAAEPVPEEKASPEVEFVCPSCFHMWEQTVSREEVFAGNLNVQPKEGQTA